MLDVQNLRKSYGSKAVLQGVSLHCAPGEIVGLVGENGAGKTTLFHCLTALTRFEGSIQHSWPGKRKDGIGFLPTTPHMLSKVTGREYLRLLAQARNQTVEDLSEKNVFELPLDRYAENYSTGMRKKLALTGILLQKPEFFLLDEPFNGVDIQSNLLIQELLQLLRQKGKPVLLSSHILGTLEETCDVLYHLREGKISERIPKNRFAELAQTLKTNGQTANKLKRLV